MMSNINGIKIVSFNVKGIRYPVKRTKVLDYLARHKADICLLQETHIDDTGLSYMKKKWVGIISPPALNGKNGVAILFEKKCVFKFYTNTLTLMVVFL